MAVNLRYEHGKFTLAATRGDGAQGDDITHNIRTIGEVPLALHPGGHKAPELIEIRGEVYFATKQFTRVNKDREEAGEDLFANPRNAAAGTLKQLDPRITAKRKLQFFAHSRGAMEPDDLQSHSQYLQAVRGWGLPTNPLIRKCTSFAQVWSSSRSLKPSGPACPTGPTGWW